MAKDYEINVSWWYLKSIEIFAVLVRIKSQKNIDGAPLGSSSNMTRRSTDANINVDQTDSIPGRPPSEQFQLEPDLEAGMRGSLPKEYFKRHDTNQAIVLQPDIRSPSFSPELNRITENESSTPQTVNSVSALETPPRPKKLNLTTEI